MKLRQVPEDFIVEEVNEFSLQATGPYKLYQITKKGVEAFSLISWLAKNNNIPPHLIGIAGLKDKHAITTQFFTIPSKHTINSLSDKNIRITYVGFVDQPLKQGDLLENKFTITVRAIPKGELEVIRTRAESAKTYGVPNYFDSQRFGSLTGEQFIGKHIVRHDYELAVKIFLTEYTKTEKKQVKDEKRMLASRWKELEKISVKTVSLRTVIDAYRRRGQWLDAYKAIPENLKNMHLYAFQSYLWNECVKEVLIRTLNKRTLYPVEYAAGKLLFFKKIADDEQKKLPQTFITIDESISKDRPDYPIIQKVLDEQGLKLQDFDIKAKTGNYFKAHPRPLISMPHEFTLSEPQPDELNHNRFKMTVRFTLGKGSYATIITKKVFGQ